MSEWREAIRAELLRFEARTGQSVVERQELIDQSLPNLSERFRGAETPEQTVSRVLQELRDRDEVEFLDNGRYRFDVANPFRKGEQYRRRHLHDCYGGNRRSGICPCSDYPFVLLFTGVSGAEYGYVDDFEPDGTFVYTGEGQVGDMTFTHGNRAIRDHAEEGRQLHLFEIGGEGMVTYLGEYEYGGHFRQELPDVNGDKRSAIRFELVPAGGTEFYIEEGDESLTALYERAKTAASGGSGGTRSRTRYSRSQAVKDFALAVADGVCQGCLDPAPFETSNGEPFLEVHHLHRRSDGGVDAPENVVAICPNCHRRAHYGADCDEFNGTLTERVANRENRL